MDTLLIYLSLIGIFIIYLFIDFLIVEAGNLNNFIEKWLERTVWIWLPFHALYRLTKEIFFKK